MTARKCRWSMLATWVMPRRSAMAMTWASTTPKGKALILLDELEGAVEVRGLGCHEAQLAPLH